MGVWEKDPLAQLSLPPGFRFFPTDEELLVQYLCKKVAGHQFSLQVIGDIDLYKFDPWDLPSKALFGEKEWYFFSPRDRKYPNGSRPNRVAGSGYWKATGTDKIITTEGRRVGIKKALVFYVGKAPKGTKTNWIMHEYRLTKPSREKGSSKLDDWVLCRIYKKGSGSQKPVSYATSGEAEYSNNGSCSSSSSHLEDVLHSLPEIDGDRFFNLPRMNSLKTILNEGNFEWASLVGLNSAPEFGQTQPPPSHGNSDAFVPSVQQPCHVGKTVEEEVQSGVKRGTMGCFQTNSVGTTQGFCGNTGEFTPFYDSNSAASVGFGYPNQSIGFGFRQ